MATTKDDGVARNNAQATANRYASGAAYQAPQPRLVVPAKELARPRVGPSASQTQAAPQRQQGQVLPSPSGVVDVRPAPQGAMVQLLQPQQPLAVEIVPQQQPVVVQAEQKKEDDRAYILQESNALVDDRWQIAQNIANTYAANEKTGERYRARLAREANDRKESARPLTQQQWSSLSPMQQAAAQANYDLSQAVLRDYKMKNQATGEQVTRYQNRVKELFGENSGTGFRGLEYAPNTIAFLDQRGLQAADLAGKNLDDLLSGDALVTTETIDNMNKAVPSGDAFHPLPADQRAKNIAFAQRLAKGQIKLQEELASKLKVGDKLIGDISSRATSQAANKSYGGQPLEERTKLTAVRPETVANFDMYMEILARTDSPLTDALQTINADLAERGASASEKSQVYQGLIERSRQAMTGEGQWFPGVDFPMRSPLEVAQALGAPALKRQTAEEGVK